MVFEYELEKVKMSNLSEELERVLREEVAKNLDKVVRIGSKMFCKADTLKVDIGYFTEGNTIALRGDFLVITDAVTARIPHCESAVCSLVERAIVKCSYITIKYNPFTMRMPSFSFLDYTEAEELGIKW